MGIEKDIVIRSGVHTNYHKINEVKGIELTEDNGKIILSISQFLNCETYDEGLGSVNNGVDLISLDNETIAIISFILYRVVLSFSAKFANGTPSHDTSNIYNLLQYLEPSEMAVIRFALDDMLQLLGVDPEDYRDLYNELKASIPGV